MASLSNKYNLTKREKEIMEVLWTSPKSLVASEIAQKGGGMSLNTVQAILRKLLKNGLIKVNEIVYSGTVLSRSYIPTISPETFEIQRLLSEQKDITTSRFVATLLEQEQEPEKLLNEINELETLLKAKRKELLGE